MGLCNGDAPPSSHSLLPCPPLRRFLLPAPPSPLPAPCIATHHTSLFAHTSLSTHHSLPTHHTLHITLCPHITLFITLCTNSIKGPLNSLHLLCGAVWCSAVLCCAVPHVMACSAHTSRSSSPSSALPSALLSTSHISPPPPTTLQVLNILVSADSSRQVALSAFGQVHLASLSAGTPPPLPMAQNSAPTLGGGLPKLPAAADHAAPMVSGACGGGGGWGVGGTCKGGRRGGV